MKIGDKVRFLNEKGGGIVKGFKDKNVAWVEDEDGFDIPMLIKECVVVETDEYNIPLKTTAQSSSNSMKGGDDFQTTEEEEDDRPITYRAPEIEGNNALNVYLAFVPHDTKNITHTTFDAYLVNDSNYLIDYIYLSANEKEWSLRCRGTIMPNMKEHLEEFDREVLNDLSHLCVQLLAYKDRCPFSLKPAIKADLWVNTVQFYKLNTFGSTPFFAEPALVYPLVKDDVEAKEVPLCAGDIRKALLEKNDITTQQHPHPKEPLHKMKNNIVEVDLHINELLDDTVGMSNAEMLEYQLDAFRKCLEDYKTKKGQKIVFIHGKGDGVLRKAILTELKRKYKSYDYQDASFREYGFGATMVTIR